MKLSRDKQDRPFVSPGVRRDFLVQMEGLSVPPSGASVFFELSSAAADMRLNRDKLNKVGYIGPTIR